MLVAKAVLISKQHDFITLGGDWLNLITFVGGVSLLGYAVAKAIAPTPPPKPKVNQELQKEDPKVVNLVQVEDLAQEKTAYCRCWRSRKVRGLI